VVDHIGRQSLFREIQLQIRSYIVDQGLKPGDILPPASQMAQRLGVSAASLREALRALEALGIIETKHGVGTFIRSYDLTPVLENLSFSLLFEPQSMRNLVQIREAIEVGVMPQVVAQIDEVHLQELEEILDKMGSEEGEEGIDRCFHRTLYACLGNSLLLEFLDVFWLVHHDLASRFMIVSTDPRTRWETHAPIVHALRRRHVEDAVQAMHAHFDGIKYQLGMVQPESDRP
jgi:DNA-binding FadR family transcriptional regulator